MRRSFGWLPALAITLFWITGTAIYLAQKEQPTGRLLGSIVSEETGVAIPNANVSLRMTSSPYHSFNQKSNSDGTFEFKRIPIGSYRLNASSRAHGLRRPVHLSLKEGETPPPLQLELMPKPPFLQLRIQQHVFSTEETPRITCHGFVRQSDLDFTLYRVDSEALIAQRGNLRRVIFPRDEHGFTSQTPQLQGNPALQETKRFARPITRKDLEGIFHQRFDLPSLNPGLYLLVVRAGDLVELDWLMLTPLALITKQWGNEALAFVTDLKTGEPVSEAKVTFSLAGHQRVTGITDQNGIFKAALPPASGATEEEDLDPHRHLLALAEKDGSQAKVDQHFYSPDYDSKERVFAYTDRPVYRPGHKVRFKGVVRTLNKEDYSVPADTPLEVKVWDPRETLVYSTQLKTNDFGSYFGEFDLNEEAATGYYRLTTKIGNSPHTSSFHVAEYRKPEYTVEVTTDKERYMRGDSIQAKVSAQYYFGAPVAGADVNYTIMRSPYYAYYGDYSYEDEYYYEYEGDYDHYGGGEIVESGTAVTGADGAAQITFSTKPPPSLSTKGGELSRDYRYTIQVQVTDPSRRWVSERTSVLVTQGEFYLSVSPKRYVVSPDESSEVEVVARDHDHNPIPGQRIVVTASSRLWYAGGSQTREETRATITTDDNGKATFKFTPTGQGSYLIEARAYDKRGNKITRTGHLWVSGAYFSSEDRSYPSLEIIAEKKTYRIGETATVLINTKSKGVTALVTIEGPTLFDYRLLQLKGNSTRLEIPITEQYSPNFYICVAFVHDKEFASRQKRIRVSVERRAMDIEITPNKTRYSPGEPATYTVQTRDWQGNPVSAEISMGVVDESIYAVRKDYTPKMADFFYPQRSNRVHTSYSFPRVYLDSEKDTGAQDIKVRKKFPDTAFWNPTIVTDAEGKASVSFEIPDTLTTWRATARGITLNTEVGETTAKVLCSKDLLVRLQTPRFFVQRDHLTLSAIAHNYTKKTQDLSVWLEAPGLRSVSGGKAAKPVNFSLEPDGIRRVDWEIEIPSSGAREITVYVKAASGLSDAMALTLPALPHGRERLEWRSGAVETEKEELFTLRQDAVPNAGDLRIRVSPSLASVVLGALEYLAKYPYGCTEQTMSAFLPDVVVAGALKELKISNPKLERELPKMVQKGLNRLYRFQHDDGGWGWWRYDDSDPWMTSYVVFGLLIAKEHG
ncbi:MAG: hypothetical protein GTN69_04815, partial [Armatimonadetes bacterium]|nr:hypothetical protein [Armatimonadota bacterium]NIO75206.1 hypothetical protein [Armatimonadota bacterium]NIO98604.1 hypothetical protein [Armatimonadota bacterium]